MFILFRKNGWQFFPENIQLWRSEPALPIVSERGTSFLCFGSLARYVGATAAYVFMYSGYTSDAVIRVNEPLQIRAVYYLMMIFSTGFFVLR